MDPELYRDRRRESSPADLGPLFGQAPDAPTASTPRERPSGRALGEEGKRRSAATHRALIDRLVPIARELARHAGSDGITVSALESEAGARRIDLGESPDWLGAVMQAAQLVSTGQYRRSVIPKKHGNLQRVWLHPEFAHS